MATAKTRNKEIKKILIIEDEGDICFLLNIILKGEHIDLEHVNTLEKARTFLSEQIPALIFLDNNLPDGRGIEFIEFIKTNYPPVKIVMITAFHSGTEKQTALDNGADIFIEKPFTKSQIYSAVEELLAVKLTSTPA